MKKSNPIELIVGILLIIGGINWGLIGLFNFDLVATIFGDMSGASRVIYTLVGLAGVYFIFTCPKMCKKG